jgi:hypothetical protein
MDAVLLVGNSAGPAAEVLALSLASIFRFAPFVQRIHVLAEEAQVALHETLNGWSPAARRRVMFREPNPAFWSDDEVAEQLLVVEPGSLLLRSARAEAFFRHGQPVLRGQWAVQENHGWWRVLSLKIRRVLNISGTSLSECRGLQGRAAAKAGYGKTYFFTGTGVQPVRRSTLVKLLASEPTCHAAWWTASGGSATEAGTWNPLSWAHHHEIQSGTAHQRPGSSGMMLDLARLSTEQLSRQLSLARMDAAWEVVNLHRLAALRAGAQEVLLPWLREVIGRGPVDLDVLSQDEKGAQPAAVRGSDEPAPSNAQPVLRKVG